MTKSALTALTVVSRALELLAVTMMAIMAVFVALSAIMRYALSAPFAFTEDLVGLLFCGVVFAALSNVELEGRHIRVDLLEGIFGERATVLQSVARRLLTGAFYLWFAKEAFGYLDFVYRSNSATVIGDIPLYPWVGLIVICLACAFLVVALKLITAGSDDTQSER